jgi:transcriptional regulator with GAF, ATPase, and Fis domain
MLQEGFSLEALEQQLIREAMDKSNGNISAAARLLGMTRPQLAYRLKKLEDRQS